MVKTNNHQYNIPSKGTTNWHVPLNDNFDDLDTDIGIRDVEGNKGNYEPKRGAKYEATDSGAVYLGNGSNWVLANRKVSSLDTEQLSHAPNQDVPQSLYANLAQGHCVGFATNGRMISVDPTDYETDDEAIQAVNDWLAGHRRPGGNIYIPGSKPDDSRWVIENQVVVGDPNEERRVQNNLYFVGYAYDEDGSGAHMTTTINDGSAMFRVVGNTSASDGDFSTVRAYNFHGGKFDLGDNNAGLVRFQYITNIDMWIEWCEDFKGDGVFFDTRCNEPHLRRGRFSPSGTSARVIVFDDTFGDGTTTQAYIGEGVNTDGDCDVTIYARGTNSLFVDGKFEGSHGIAHIDARSTANDGCNLYVTPKCHLGNNHSGSHGIYFDGFKAVIMPGKLNMIDGHGIVIDGAAQAIVSDAITYNAVSGDCIVVNKDNSNSTIVVPHESVVGRSDDTVDYPPAPWRGVRYHSGWRLFREETITVPAGRSRIVNEYGAKQGEETKTTVEFAAEPTADVQIAKRIGWSSSTNQTVTVIEETTGNGDAEITSRLFVR